MNVCQGICLGQQNSLLPLAVFSGVGLLNVVLDVWLILGGPAMGATGAAIATAAAQWIGAGYFLRHLIQKVRLCATVAIFLKSLSSSRPAVGHCTSCLGMYSRLFLCISFALRGLVFVSINPSVQGKEGKSVEIQWMGLPTARDLQPFIGMASVLLSRTIFSMSAFTLITGVATAQGTIAAASHQVCLQLFWFLSYFPEPLSVAAQSLIARDRGTKSATLQLTRCILGLAAGLGVTTATACAVAFVYGASIFTPDPVIASTMMSIAKPAFFSLILCCFAMSVDGISIGSDDYKHLPVVNFTGLAATAAWLQWCTMQNLGLPGIWMGMVVVFAVRLSVHLLHHLGTHAHTSIIAAALRIPEFTTVALRNLPVRGVALSSAT
jgi:Na+-driven multidrug efflux pump